MTDDFYTSFIIFEISFSADLTVRITSKSDKEWLKARVAPLEEKHVVTALSPRYGAL